ncbi:uncharacterized protein [Dermacentor andersoni]|uniref:uncharacterized protein n=1 Tax=Dermacentor andersoni TaxID=34620 RepID=UPI002415E1C6|nr:uncharacterized protein LOC129380726 [Dermacentor andersoni]
MYLLVFQAQEHFNNQSVMIKIKVNSTMLKDDWLVFYKNNKSINGPETLKNMTRYAQTVGASNNSILYHASGYSIYSEDKGKEDNYSKLLSDVCTNGTFCRGPSAVIFVEFQGQYNPRSMVRGTAGTFGVHKVYFTLQDLKTMNATFANCKQGKRRRRKGQGNKGKGKGKKGKGRKSEATIKKAGPK